MKSLKHPALLGLLFWPAPMTWSPNPTPNPKQLTVGELTQEMQSLSLQWSKLAPISEELTLVFNSSGGQLDVGEALLIDNKRMRQTGKNTFRCQVLRAQSMAYAILDKMCDTIIIYPNTELLWHQPYYRVSGSKDIHLEQAEQLVIDLKRSHNRMMELITPTFTTNIKLFAESYVNSETWLGSVFYATFNPPKKWQMEASSVQVIP